VAKLLVFGSRSRKSWGRAASGTFSGYKPVILQFPSQKLW